MALGCDVAGRWRVPADEAAEREYFVVVQSVFAGEHLLAALNHLADQRGHEGHDRHLGGETEQTDRYLLQCTYRQVIAITRVDRDHRPGGR